MEAGTAAFWIERIAFIMLLMGSAGIDHGIYSMPAVVITLLVVSNAIYFISVLEKLPELDQQNIAHDQGKRNGTAVRSNDPTKSTVVMEKQKPIKQNNAHDHQDAATVTKKKATNDEDGDLDLTLKSSLYEILKKATSNCDAEKITYWHELVNKLMDEYKKYRAICDEELREAKERCEQEFKNQLETTLEVEEC